MKDMLGVVTEESIRKNFVLVYEIIDEILVRKNRDLELLKSNIFIMNRILGIHSSQVQIRLRNK